MDFTFSKENSLSAQIDTLPGIAAVEDTASRRCLISSQIILAQFVLCLAFVLVKCVGVNIQRCACLCMTQQTSHCADIHALRNQQAGVCMPQTVYMG